MASSNEKACLHYIYFTLVVSSKKNLFRLICELHVELICLFGNNTVKSLPEIRYFICPLKQPLPGKLVLWYNIQSYDCVWVNDNFKQLYFLILLWIGFVAIKRPKRLGRACFKQDLQLHKTWYLAHRKSSFWPESLHFLIHTSPFSIAHFNFTTAQIERANAHYRAYDKRLRDSRNT